MMQVFMRVLPANGLKFPPDKTSLWSVNEESESVYPLSDFLYMIKYLKISKIRLNINSEPKICLLYCARNRGR